MSNEKVPSSLAASVKILVDSIQNTFAAAVIVIIFLGMTLFTLACGSGDISPDFREYLILFLIIAICSILVVLFLLRIFKPTGLSGPPQPYTEDVDIHDSSYSPSRLSRTSSISVSSSSRSPSVPSQDD